MTLILIGMGQTCIGQGGDEVEWWVVLKVPPNIGKTGFGYYDSTIKTGKFIYYDIKIDIGITALTQTIQYINNLNL